MKYGNQQYLDQTEQLFYIKLSRLLESATLNPKRLQTFVCSPNPVVARPYIGIKFPDVKRAKVHLYLYLYAIYMFHDYGLDLHRLLSTILYKAQRKEFKDDWEIWRKAIKYFNLPFISHEIYEYDGVIHNTKSFKRAEELDENIFSPQDFIVFLETHSGWSRHNLITDIVRNVAKVHGTCRLVDSETQERHRDRRKVKRAQRKRGYDDHGTARQPQKILWHKTLQDLAYLNDPIEKLLHLDLLKHIVWIPVHPDVASSYWEEKDKERKQEVERKKEVRRQRRKRRRERKRGREP